MYNNLGVVCWLKRGNKGYATFHPLKYIRVKKDGLKDLGQNDGILFALNSIS